MCNSKCCGQAGGMCTMGMIAKVLIIVGGLNWGLVGVGILMGSEWNLVNMIFSSMPKVEAIVYVVVGLSALVMLFGGCKCAKCSGGTCATCSSGEKM